MTETGLQFLYTVVTIAVLLCFQIICRKSLSRFATRRKINKSRLHFIQKLTYYTLIILALLALVVIWGIAENVAVFISGVLGLIAIGFFAVWSMLSNILAGFFLFLSDPFRIDDEIVVLPEEISGKVREIKLLFVVLENQQGDILHIPNNFLFQKVIKKTNNKPNKPDVSGAGEYP